MSTEEATKPGYCSAVPTDKTNFQRDIEKPLLKTSDIYATCNLPKRFEHPHWFNGYGSQTNTQHPFYRTSSSEYGWYPPGYHSVPNVYYPADQRFTRRLAEAGMYRNCSLNTAPPRADDFR